MYRDPSFSSQLDPSDEVSYRLTSLPQVQAEVGLGICALEKTQIFTCMIKTTISNINIWSIVGHAVCICSNNKFHYLEEYQWLIPPLSPTLSQSAYVVMILYVDTMYVSGVLMQGFSIFITNIDTFTSKYLKDIHYRFGQTLQ